MSYSYTSDHLDSTREMLNSSGTIVARYSYDPYGRVALVSGSNLATFQFTGDYSHAASGLNLTLYRAYDPTTGRWLSRDPLQGAEMFQGPDLYTYVHDNPDDLLDDLGLGSRFPTTPNHGGGNDAPEPPSNDLGDDVKACFAGILANLEGIAKGDLPETLLPSRYN